MADLNIDIEQYPLADEVRLDAEKVIKFVEDWKKNPLHWTNNKRRLHGYCALRGKANRKDRFSPSQALIAKVANGMASKICTLVEQIMSDNADHMFDDLVDINDFPLGQRQEFRRT